MEAQHMKDCQESNNNVEFLLRHKGNKWMETSSTTTTSLHTIMQHKSAATCAQNKEKKEHNPAKAFASQSITAYLIQRILWGFILSC